MLGLKLAAGNKSVPYFEGAVFEEPGVGNGYNGYNQAVWLPPFVPHQPLYNLRSMRHGFSTAMFDDFGGSVQALTPSI